MRIALKIHSLSCLPAVAGVSCATLRTDHAVHEQKETKTTKNEKNVGKTAVFVCFVIFCSKIHLIAPNQVNPTAVYSPEVVCRYGNTKSDDADAHQRSINPAHHASAHVTTKQRAGCHNRTVLPIHPTFDHEYCYSNGSEAAT
jgi:hypothetical protein